MARINRYTQGFNGAIVRDLLINYILSEDVASEGSTITLISAYTNAHGVLLISSALESASERGVILHAIVDRDGLTREGLNALCHYFDEVIVIAFNGLISHSKQFVVLNGSPDNPTGAVALEGSANLTGAGLSLNIEEVIITNYSNRSDIERNELAELIESVRRKSDPEALVHGQTMGLASPEEPNNAVWIIMNDNSLIENNYTYVIDELQSEYRRRGFRRRRRINQGDGRRLSGRSPGRRTQPLPDGCYVSAFRYIGEDNAENDSLDTINESALSALDELQSEINFGEVDLERLESSIIGFIGECEVTNVSKSHAARERMGTNFIGIYKALSLQDAELYHGGSGPVTEISWPAVGRFLVGEIDDGYQNAHSLDVRSYDLRIEEIVDSNDASIWRRRGRQEMRIGGLDISVWRDERLQAGDIAIFVPIRSMAVTTPLANLLNLDENSPHILMIIVPLNHPLHNRFPVSESTGEGQGTLRYSS